MTWARSPCLSPILRSCARDRALAIKLARTREMDNKMLGLFKHERERIDQLISQAPNSIPSPPSAVTAKAN